MGSTPGGIFKKTHNPHLVPLPMGSKKATKKKIDKFKKYFFPKINMLLQATYFSTINPQFVGLPTHILRPPPPNPTHNPQVKNLGSAHVQGGGQKSWPRRTKVLTLSKTLKRCFLVQNCRENTFLKCQDFCRLGQDFCPPRSGLFAAQVRTFVRLGQDFCRPLYIGCFFERYRIRFCREICYFKLSCQYSNFIANQAMFPLKNVADFKMYRLRSPAVKFGDFGLKLFLMYRILMKQNVFLDKLSKKPLKMANAELRIFLKAQVQIRVANISFCLILCLQRCQENYFLEKDNRQSQSIAL